MEVKLIELVKANESLYSREHPEYQNSEKRRETWEKLVGELQFPGTREQLATRWKTLRDRFAKELKLVKNGEETRWKLFENMRFLESFMKEKAPKDEGLKVYLSDDCFLKLLIREVKTHSVLTNKTDVNFYHEAWRTASWNAVIKKLSFPGEIKEISAVWRRLRHRYNAEKRVKNKKGFSTWAMFGELTFLDEQVNNHETRQNITDDDSAFAGSVVAYWKLLPETARAAAKEKVLEVLRQFEKTPNT